MSFALAFWILMGIWLIFGFYTRDNTNPKLTVGGNALIIFILLVLLGWKVFQAPLNP